MKEKKTKAKLQADPSVTTKHSASQQLVPYHFASPRGPHPSPRDRTWPLHRLLRLLLPHLPDPRQTATGQRLAPAPSSPRDSPQHLRHSQGPGPSGGPVPRRTPPSRTVYNPNGQTGPGGGERPPSLLRLTQHLRGPQERKQPFPLEATGEGAGRARARRPHSPKRCSTKGGEGDRSSPPPSPTPRPHSPAAWQGPSADKDQRGSSSPAERKAAPPPRSSLPPPPQRATSAQRPPHTATAPAVQTRLRGAAPTLARTAAARLRLHLLLSPPRSFSSRSSPPRRARARCRQPAE